MGDLTTTHQQVQDYYGNKLQATSDLQTSACCVAETPPAHITEALLKLEPDVLKRFYGCGSPVPDAIVGKTILDLGCGAGRDAYVLAQLVGANGRVIGVDMTPEQLAVAEGSLHAHMQNFGYATPNVSFHHGQIEDLQAVGIADNSIDVVISNCVINLAPDKRPVFEEIHRVLRPGGELYFADVFAGRRIPTELHDDPVLRGECLSGALYTEDFRRMMQTVGFLDARIVSSRRMTLDNPEIEARIGMVDFYSRTVRAFKLDTLEDICEDYGQVAVYHGTIPHHPHHYDLDDHHRFFRGKPMLVCGNTASMVQETRLGAHFEVRGDRSTHFGPFDCSPAAERNPEDAGAGGACC